LEEDVVTAPGFLSFMNHALDTYEANEKIFSITGYCPPIKIPGNYTQDAFVLRRFNAWGFGIWIDRYASIKYVSPDDYEELAADKQRARQFLNGQGEDMLRMLKADAYGQIDALDVKAIYAQYLADMYTVYPARSLARNIGLDGSGVHCGRTRKFDVELSQKISFALPEELVVDRRILKANHKFRSRNRYLEKMREILYRAFRG
jgi:hypothetical protein